MGIVSASAEDVLDALEKGEPERLLGVGETARIRFREQAYALDKGTGRWELAEDVAELASGSGGVIVIGVRAAVAEGDARGVAVELRAVPAGMLDADRYHDVIREQVRPAVRADVGYFPARNHARRGYLSIRVEPLGGGRQAAAWDPRARYRPLGEPRWASTGPARGTTVRSG
jgi:hypothetical protein